MKKLLPSLLVCVLCLISLRSTAQFTFSITAPQQCYTGSNSSSVVITNPQAGATSYSWAITSPTTCIATMTITSPNGTLIGVSYPCCGIYTITCTAYNGNTIVGSPVINTATIYCQPTINVMALPGAIGCAGSIFTLSATGGVTYTWSIGFFGANIVVSPSVSTCYSVAGTSPQGCVGMAVQCITLSPTPTISVNVLPLGNAVCAGGTATLSATGGVTYTWQPGALNSPTVFVTPFASTQYTVGGSSPLGCNGFTTVIIIVNPVPTLNIVSPSSVCLGQSATLTASGANSYQWNAGPNTSTNVVYPLVNTCYSVIGTFAGTGCNSMTTACVNVTALPSLTVTGSPSICLGSSITYTASGADTYSWNTGANTPSIIVSPTTYVIYTVTGTSTVTGCTSVYTITSYVDPTCSQVWPGDANSDGIVNSTDVLEVGLQIAATGAARTPTSNAYSSQFANNWTGTVTTGKNKCHADCDGNGVVNVADTVAISLNFSLTHTFKLSAAPAAPIVQLVPLLPTADAGLWNKADIILGDAANPVSQLYGLTFEIGFDPAMIESNSAYIVYSGSFLNASGQNIEFRKNDFPSGKIYAASVRTTGNNVNGTGKIGEFFYKVKTGLADNAALNLSITNPQQVDKNGITGSLNGSSASLNVNNNPDWVSTGKVVADRLIGLFPNPTTGKINVVNSTGSETRYHLFDVVGREIMTGVFAGNVTLDLGNLQQGTYLLKVETSSGIVNKKLILNK